VGKEALGRVDKIASIEKREQKEIYGAFLKSLKSADRVGDQSNQRLIV